MRAGAFDGVELFGSLEGSSKEGLAVIDLEALDGCAGETICLQFPFPRSNLHASECMATEMVPCFVTEHEVRLRRRCSRPFRVIRDPARPIVMKECCRVHE